MRIYLITDEIKEEIVNVFISKNDKTASKQLENELKSVGKEIEMKLYSLDITVDYDDKVYAFFDNSSDNIARSIYSFPKDLIENKEKLKEDIFKDSNLEEN